MEFSGFKLLFLLRSFFLLELVHLDKLLLILTLQFVAILLLSHFFRPNVFFHFVQELLFKNLPRHSLIEKVLLIERHPQRIR